LLRPWSLAIFGIKVSKRKVSVHIHTINPRYLYTYFKIGDAVTFAFPDTSANAPLSGKRGVVEALPGGEYPDRYVVFVAATADSDQRRLAVKREHLEFFARGL